VPKGSHLANKKTKYWVQQNSKGQPKAPLVWRTGLSGVPPDMSGAPEDSNFKLVAFGKFQRQLRYNSPDCPVYTGHVRCSKEERPQELASLGNSLRLLRYNSPECPVYTGLSGVHRTVRCNSGATTTSGANGYLRHIKCAPARAEVRHAHA
jgi:hypothetical protein